MPNSDDMDGMWAGKFSHAVEHARTNCRLGRLGSDLARPLRPPPERLESIRRVLGQRAAVIAAEPDPLAPAARCEGIDSYIALCRRKRGIRPRHRAFAGWKRRRRSASGNRLITRGVISVIASSNLVAQFRDLCNKPAGTLTPKFLVRRLFVEIYEISRCEGRHRLRKIPFNSELQR